MVCRTVNKIRASVFAIPILSGVLRLTNIFDEYFAELRVALVVLTWQEDAVAAFKCEHIYILMT